MKTLYIECGMGAAGDMLMAALLELRGDRDDFLRRLNSAGIPGVVVTAELSKKCGIVGTRVRVAVDGREEEGVDVDSYEHHHHGDGSRPHDHDEHHFDNVNNDDRNCHSLDNIHHDNHHHHDNISNHHNSHEHSHNSYIGIEHLINHLNISAAVKENALEVYKLLAESESRAHGVPVDRIHFHEVGEADAVADIVGVCMLIDELAPDVILSSPINLGGGHVRCAHGLLPVPAPATANILQNVPVYSDSADGELCTPTGAALLKHFVNGFRKMPVMTVAKTGYGMGARNFEKANCLRAYIGDISEVGGVNDIGSIDNMKNSGEENIAELSCNLDDMTPEAVSFAQQLLFDEGALDVYTLPVIMKKGRAGLIFTCLCRLDDREKMLRLIFRHTATLGVREYVIRRYVLQREHTELQTANGPVRVKTASGFGVRKSKPEYEDVARIAREKGMSIEDVLSSI